MNYDINMISSKIKNNKKSNRSTKLKNFISRVLITIILVLVSVIYINKSDKNLLLYKDHIFGNDIELGKFNKFYKKYLGNIFPYKESAIKTTNTVFNEINNYTSIKKFNNGFNLKVETENISTIQSGIVVFVGDKEDYNKTVIIQGIDGVDIWYGNLDTVNVAIYDYVEKSTIVGSVKDNKFLVLLQKDKEYLNYEDYIK